MNQKAEIQWKNGMAFEATVSGHKIMLDADEQVGGQDLGPRPKPLTLAALGGCSGMDVVSILKKMQVNLDDFRMDITGELTDEHPKVYHTISIKYIFKGTNLPIDKLEKAINLSQEKYCGVSAMLGKAAQINWEIVIES